MKLKDLIADKRFLDMATKWKKPNTVRVYRFQWGKLARLLPGKDISEFDNQYIQVLISKMERLGMSQRTQRQYLYVLRGILDIAVKIGELDRVPFDWGAIDKPASVSKTDRPTITRDKIKELIDSMPESDIRDMVIVAANTGLRQSNLLGLRWDWIDMKQRLIQIPGSELKGRGDRDKKPLILPMSKATYEVLVRRLSSGLSSVYVFKKKRGRKPYSATQARKMLEPYKKRVGLDSMRWHDMRHFFVSECLRRGVGLFLTSKLANHANVKTTMGYAHADVEDFKQAISKAFPDEQEVTDGTE